MKRPFVLICMIFILGVYTFYSITVDLLTLYILISIVILIIISKLVLNISKISGYVLILFLMFILSGIVVNYNLNMSELYKFKDQEVLIQGIIKNNLKGNDTSKLVLNASKVIFNNKEYKINEKVLLICLNEKGYKLGDEVVIKGYINVPKKNSNPGLFNYRLFLYTKKIFTIMNVKNYNVKIIEEGKLNYLEKIVYSFKKRTFKLFDNLLNQKFSSIIKAIILGDSSYLELSKLKEFRSLGIAHVLAVSGLHIGIIYGLFFFLFRILRIKNKINIIITLIILWFYGLIIGFPASVLRALVMFSILMLSKVIHSRYDALNGLFFSCLILLIYNPLWLFSIGFQLSFIATLSLILLNKPIKEKIPIYKNILPPILSVQIGLMPIMMFHFNEIFILSIFVNIIVIPIISLVVVLSFLIIILSYMNFNLVILLSYVLKGSLYILSNIIYVFNYIPIKNVTIYSPSIEDIFFYYLSVIIIFNIIDMNIFISVKKFLFIYFSIAIGLLFIISINNKDIEMNFLDVGQGDSIVIKGYNKAFLIDGGGSLFKNYKVGEKIVLPYLLKTRTNKLEGIFITHLDADHLSGIISLLGKVKIKNIFISYEDYENSLYVDLLKKAKKYNIPVVFLNKGDKVYINNKFYFNVLNPLSNIKTYKDNDMSLVLLLEANDKKILLTGDIEGSIEKILVDENSYKIDLLKIAHHGSNTSTTKGFIESFRPDYGIISVGKNNYGHPSKEILERLNKNNIRVYRTDKDGMITGKINENLTISNYIKAPLLLRDIISNNIINIILSFILIFCFFVLFKKYMYNEKITSKYKR
ncbi:MAG: DNA internalization-related competence protein ComEC/Rec2 [Firmicutes bacterium]|nr:DNA internalization-related competence protein ComEC/Rec2 [Bacillota bacterium]